MTSSTRQVPWANVMNDCLCIDASACLNNIVSGAPLISQNCDKLEYFSLTKNNLSVFCIFVFVDFLWRSKIVRELFTKQNMGGTTPWKCMDCIGHVMYTAWSGVAEVALWSLQHDLATFQRTLLWIVNDSDRVKEHHTCYRTWDCKGVSNIITHYNCDNCWHHKTINESYN